MPQRAALYARISLDRDGEALGVARQLQDCTAYAATKGWPVADTYVDNDTSAYSGKSRPEYKRLLNDIKDGLIDAVIVWHIDRLHRRPNELEEFAEICATAGLTDLATVTGDLNLGTHDGMLIARILSAVARKESDDKSRRISRKHLELAQRGRPAGGQRPFGYDLQRVPIPEEAAAIREAVQRILAGDSLSSLCRSFDERGLKSRSGLTWTPTALRGILMHPRIAGLRALRGEVIAPATWDAIISADDSARIRAVLSDPLRRTTRPARRYLLTGFLTCGLCGAKLVGRPKRDKRSYSCTAGPGFKGCGRLGIMAEPTEEFLHDALIYRLDSPGLAKALGHAANPLDQDDLFIVVARDEAQLEELAGMYAANQITAPEWLHARKAIEDRLRRSRLKLAATNGKKAVAPYVGHPEALSAQWATLNLDRRRAIVAALVDHVTVLPAKKLGRVFDYERLQPAWKA